MTDLGEFWLAVISNSLISVTTSYLEVSVKTSYHQQLLELLGRLDQGVKKSLVLGRNYKFLSSLQVDQKLIIFWREREVFCKKKAATNNLLQEFF